jgi:hypothetical protein
MFNAIGRAVQVQDDGTFRAHVEFMDANAKTVRYADYMATSLADLQALDVPLEVVATPVVVDELPAAPTKAEREAVLAAAIVGAELGAI